MKQTSYLIYMLVFMIVGIVNVTVINAYRIRKGELADKLYDKLNIEPVWISHYTKAYNSVSEYISRPDYIERAKRFSNDFRYDVVKYMNNEMPPSELKDIKAQLKRRDVLHFSELPEELQKKAGEVAQEYAKTVEKMVRPKPLA